MDLLQKQIEGLIFVSADEGITLNQLLQSLEAQQDQILQLRPQTSRITRSPNKLDLQNYYHHCMQI